MFHSDRLLFDISLTDCLNSSQECKRLWLESVKIAVRDFTVVNKQTPTQPAITEFFQWTARPDTQPVLGQTQDWRDTDTYDALFLLLPDHRWAISNQKGREVPLPSPFLLPAVYHLACAL
eukprot:15327608-Ditylum_brightwellii.AAC.1